MSDFERRAAEDHDALPELGPLDGEPGPALPLSAAALARLADQIEHKFAAPKPVLRWRPRLRPRRLLIAGSLVAASAAAAVYGVATLRSGVEPQHAAPAARSSPLPPAVSAPDLRLAPPSQPTEPESGAERETTRRNLAKGPTSSSASRSEEGGRTKGTPGRSAAADRLATANALRAEHRYRDALALYLRIIESYPNSIQASVARVAAAEIRLEQFGDIDGAERLYREAKTKGGELTAEAQFGLAQVFRARSDTAGERRALQEFVARHPESPLVSAARRRLQALGAQ